MNRMLLRTYCFKKDNETALPVGQNFIMAGIFMALSHSFKDVYLALVCAGHQAECS